MAPLQERLRALRMIERIDEVQLPAFSWLAPDYCHLPCDHIAAVLVEDSAGPTRMKLCVLHRDAVAALATQRPGWTCLPLTTGNVAPPGPVAVPLLDLYALAAEVTAVWDARVPTGRVPAAAICEDIAGRVARRRLCEDALSVMVMEEYGEFFDPDSGAWPGELFERCRRDGLHTVQTETLTYSIVLADLPEWYAAQELAPAADVAPTA